MNDGRTGRSAPPARMLEEAAEMRRSGYQVVDAIVDRWSALPDGPPWRAATRDATESLLHGPPPEEGRAFGPLLQTVLHDVMPLAGRIDHPRFLAFVPSSPSWASVLASFLMSGYNVFQGTWLESAGPSQIELTVTDWFREWLGYPEGAGGLFTSGGSAANLMAIVAAREAAGNPERGTLYMSNQAHGSVGRAARIVGIDPDRTRLVPTDRACRIVTARLREAIRRDREAGREPFCLVGTAGTTNTGAVDPLEELAGIAREEGMWCHLDAAYGGFAVLDPETRPLLEGLELADSVTLDPHKWLFQPYETGCLMVRDVTRLESAFRIMPDYMQDADWGHGHVNFCDRGLQLTRAFRALRVWLAVQRYGVGAHRREIARGIAIASRAAARIREERELELLAPHSLGVVCFRFRGREGETGPERGGTFRSSPERIDDLNREIQDRIVASGVAMISSTRLAGRFSLRFCVLNARTTDEDVQAILDRVVELGRELSEDPGRPA
ncbi:MAG: aminotransferase class I/II-fold pyridoxal phosphate-dependent enzyme [Gemmatimonadota bacterium]|nr:aminotransferase class I/II-fold pyridoxal phosphate-dependent enzyme [Gemmatimonadota bacterium]MDE2870383.1 aminotransferase class I/II-fold pyridoxal phosphate-dependent enzyme [Gemmatimonadota bacterium]